MTDIKSVVDGENPFIQVGYVGLPEKKRKIGEEWVDKDGITWKQEKNTKTRISHGISSVRDSLKQFCSKCGQDIRWGNRYDEKMFLKTGKCYNCVIEDDTSKMLNGSFAHYDRLKILENKYSLAKEFKIKLKETIDYLTSYDGKLKYHNAETNSEEVWLDQNKDFLLEEATKDLQKTEELIVELSAEIESLKDNLGDTKK